MDKKMLVLENGKVFYGEGFGSDETKIAEIIPNTLMVGYQEVLSDPANCNKFVLITYPLIGNYGLTDEDYESKNIYISGMIVGEYNDQPSNFRFTQTLGEVMEDNHVVGIEGLDTRAIATIIRKEGSMKAMIAPLDKNIEECLKEIADFECETDLVKKVSTKKVWHSRTRNPEFNVVAVDGGIMLSAVRTLKENGCNVTVVPYDTSAEEILKFRPDGLFLSTGPGNPENFKNGIELVKKLHGVTPILGTGLGAEVIALAYGAKTSKMNFGHVGANRPVKNIKTGKIEFNNQNCLFKLEADSFAETELEITHIDAFDGAVEGFVDNFHKVLGTMSYPENQARPVGVESVFDTFKQFMKDFGGKNNAKEN